MSEIENNINEIVNRLLDFIGIKADVVVAKSEDEENSYKVDLSGEDLGVVIGYHGDGLMSIQTLLGLILSKQMGVWTNVTVDANGYRKEREDKLREMAKNAADKVKFSLTAVELPPMSASDRRVIHMEVGKIEGVVSESAGEGYSRRVIVKPS